MKKNKLFGRVIDSFKKGDKYDEDFTAKRLFYVRRPHCYYQFPACLFFYFLSGFFLANVDFWYHQFLGFCSQFLFAYLFFFDEPKNIDVGFCAFWASFMFAAICLFFSLV